MKDKEYTNALDMLTEGANAGCAEYYAELPAEDILEYERRYRRLKRSRSIAGLGMGKKRSRET